MGKIWAMPVQTPNVLLFSWMREMRNVTDRINFPNFYWRIHEISTSVLTSDIEVYVGIITALKNIPNQEKLITSAA